MRSERVASGRRRAGVVVLAIAVLPMMAAARCTEPQVEGLIAAGRSAAGSLHETGATVPVRGQPRFTLTPRSFDTAAAESEVEALAASSAFDGLDSYDAIRVADGACQASDLVELGGADSVGDAVEKVIAMGKGTGAHRAQMRQLAGDLDDADSLYEQGAIAGKAAFCQAASQYAN